MSTEVLIEIVLTDPHEIKLQVEGGGGRWSVTLASGSRQSARYISTR